MSWGNWHNQPPPMPGVVSAPPLQSTVLPNPINAAPPILPPSTAMPAGMQYTPEQWAQMQQQNWQQWAQWQQQYQQWHQQYGAEYQKSMNAISAPVIPSAPGGAPPPPPNENKPPPPPPPDDTSRSSHYNIGGYNTAPPNMGVPPPNWQNANNKRPLAQNPDYEANKRQMTEQWNKGMQPKPALQQVGQKIPNLEELTEAEKKFDKEFAAWEAQFNKWKEQNANHPDKTQYAEYEKKWESWRNSLLDRREQMRKKRLAVQASLAAAAKPPVVQQPIKPKEPLLDNFYNKPPPTQNNEPLSFKPSSNASYIRQQQDFESDTTGNDFLKSSSPTPGGIPGLDLVKDGNLQDNIEEDEIIEVPNKEVGKPPVVNKGPDLEAISKGINTILGDPKLLNILSRVSQNQNLAATSSIPPSNVQPIYQPSNTSNMPYQQPQHQQSNTPNILYQQSQHQQSNPQIIPPHQQSNPKIIPYQQPQQQQNNPPSLLSLTVKPPPNMHNNYNEYSEPQYSEPINNFDDQTRMSFTNTNGPNDQDMGYNINNSSNNSNFGKFNDRRYGNNAPSGQNNFRNINNGPGFNNNANFGNNSYKNRKYDDNAGYKQDNDYNEEPYQEEENWQEEEEYDKYHNLFNEGDQSSNNVPDNQNMASQENEPEVEEPFFVPQVVVDYEHKSLKEPEPEISLEMTRMFDYRHKPVNRIPYPQRPIWLSSTLRNIQQFDPLGASRFNINNDLGYDRRNNDDFRYSRERYPTENRMEWNDKRDFGREKIRERDNFKQQEFGRENNFKQQELGRENNFKQQEFGRENYNRPKSNRQFEEPKPLELEDLSDDDWNEDRNSPQKQQETLKFSPPKRKNERTLSIEPPAKNNPTGNSTVFSENTTLEELINPPGRFKRPQRIVIILRGPPGSGKTYLAKLIKDKEVENGGSAPRILSLDDYFMVEHEKQVIEDGKLVRVKEMIYEYEAEMEESYRQSLVKAFKKTIKDGYFPFVVVDNVNEKVKSFGEMWSFAKQNGFQVYICQLDLDPNLCMKRNIHHRTESYIEDCIASWEPTPAHHPLVDPTGFLQNASTIQEVEMEVADEEVQEENNDDGESPQGQASRWDTFDCSINNLARLDGVSKPLRPSRTMEEYLQLDNNAEWYEPEKPTKPGQKRVRWADLEEQKQQRKMKALGFVVGHTNWDRMMDPTNGESALTQTKYIERRSK